LLLQLKTIEHLLAAGSKSEKVVVLGMLSQLHEVGTYIEDKKTTLHSV
jgi:hypothetical protein